MARKKRGRRKEESAAREPETASGEATDETADAVEPAEGPDDRLRGWFGRHRALLLAAAAVFALSASFHTWIEFQMAGPLSADGYYHIKIAELYRTGECSLFGGDFPWTRFSSFNDLRCDWQLLYHVLLIPFTLFELGVGAKLSAVFFAAVLLTTIYVLLRLHHVPWPWLFTLLAAFGSPSLIWRQHLPRPTTLIITVFLILAHLLARRKPWAVLGLGVVAMWIYNVPHSLLALAGVALVVSSVDARRPVWKPAAALLGAIVLGVVLHPGFWHWEGSFFSSQHATFQLWAQIQGTVATAPAGAVDVDGVSVPMRLGVELNALNGHGIRNEFSLPLALVIGALMLVGLGLQRKARPKIGPLGQMMLGLTALYFYLFLGSMRFMEYWVPFAVLGAALAIRDSLDNLPILGGDPEAIAAREAQPDLAVRLCQYGAALLLLVQLFVLLGADVARPGSWTPALIAGGLLVVASVLLRLPAGLEQIGETPPRLLFLGGLVVVGALAGLGVGVGLNARTAVGMLSQEGDHYGHKYEAAMEWLEASSDPGDLVFHTDWDDFAPMFFYNHTNHYIVGFDPYFLFQHDPQRYKQWVDICSGNLDITAIRDGLFAFGTRYILTTDESNWRRFETKIRQSGLFPAVYEDKFIRVYKVY